MKFLRWLPIAVVVLGIASTASANYSSIDQFNERDFESTMNFIKSKRSIPLEEKLCDLMISGDIRFEWENIQEKQNGVKMRGKNAPQTFAWFRGERIPSNQFDVDFNLMLDYRGPCTWAVAHLEFDNNAGIDISRRGCCGYLASGCENDELALENADRIIYGDPNGSQGSGTFDRICLRKAFFGWNLFEECNSRLDIELGRRTLYDVFDSRVMFRSWFDGILFRYTNCFECVGDFYTNLGFFVVDENANNWAWAVEVGLLDIADYCIDFKYSFIDWAVGGANRCDISNPLGLQYKVSQFYLAYNLNPELFCNRAKIYGAFLVNHDAAKKRNISITDSQNNFDYLLKQNNKAWYVGFLVGDVCKEGDWSFDVNYQYVELNAFPEYDLSGIGKGNVRDIPMTLNPAYGWLNYQGMRMEALYALTDNLVIRPIWEFSQNISNFRNNGNLGASSDQVKALAVTEAGKHLDSSYNKFEIEVIYAF